MKYHEISQNLISRQMGDKENAPIIFFTKRILAFYPLSEESFLVGFSDCIVLFSRIANPNSIREEFSIPIAPSSKYLRRIGNDQ